MKKYLCGFLSAVLLMSLIVPAVAITGRQSIEVDPINIMVNGQTFVPKDVNGAEVPVFAYNGTTYAPLRALAEAYGLEVGYDAASNMATVSKPGAAQQPATSAPQKETPASPATVPLLEHEYGPMTLTNYYSSGKVMNTNHVTSLVFTEIKKTSNRYTLYCNMQGITDYDAAWVILRFFGANNRVLAEATLIKEVAPNEEYNVLAGTSVDADALENAVRIGFYSHSGREAVMEKSTSSASTGSSAGAQSTGKTADDLVGYLSSKSDRTLKKTYTIDNGKQFTASVVYWPDSSTLHFGFMPNTNGSPSTSCTVNIKVPALSVSSGPSIGYNGLGTGANGLPKTTSFTASANLSPASYTKNTALAFTASANSGDFSNSEIDDYCNSMLQLAVASWNVLLSEHVGMTLGDIGFTSY